MSDKITAENLIESLVDTFVEKKKTVSFFEGEKSDSVGSQINRLFGREKPVHHILGGGKCMVFKLCTSLYLNYETYTVLSLTKPFK